VIDSQQTAIRDKSENKKNMILDLNIGQLEVSVCMLFEFSRRWFQLHSTRLSTRQNIVHARRYLESLGGSLSLEGWMSQLLIMSSLVCFDSDKSRVESSPNSTEHEDNIPFTYTCLQAWQRLVSYRWVCRLLIAIVSYRDYDY